MSVNQKPSPLSMLTFTTYHYNNLKDILEYADTERDLELISLVLLHNAQFFSGE